MTKILIVEGNSAEIIRSKRENGLPIASDKYIEALSIHAPDARYDVGIPYAPELQNSTINMDEYDAVALTGSGVAWSSCDEQAKPYLDYLESVFAIGKPVIGSCWGMQCVVQLFGGTCTANENGTEIGLAEDIELSTKGRGHWIFADMPDRFPSPCIHRDHVTALPDCFDLLASNPVSKVQAVAYNGADHDYVGFQFHPEFDLNYVSAIKQNTISMSGTCGIVASFPENPPHIVSDIEARTRVFANWIHHIQSKKAAPVRAA